MSELSPIDAGVTLTHTALATPPPPGSAVNVSAPDGAPTLHDYEITGRLGEGGMGVVWRATQRSTRREVALKLMNTAAFGSLRARRRFEREVELAARLEHPHIARVYDAGTHGGLSYYAMELVDGLPLDAYAHLHRLDRRDILRIMRGVCDGVQHAHQRGVIHRDLKPSNILVTPERRAVVLDFGLAKALTPDDAANPLSIEGQVAGTPAFMSPEQAAGRGAEVDTRSDVYSLGVILYRLLTGQSPHDLTGSSLDVLRRIATAEPRRPRQASKDASRIIDRELETLLLKCLAKEPDQRYASAGALGQDLDNYLRGEPLLAKRPTATYVLRRRLHKHRVAAGVMGAGLVVLAAGTGYAKFRPAGYVLDSEPVGATILVNGEPKSGCEMTPCVAELPFGRHEIRLSKQGYQDSIRIVEVDWGGAKIVQSESWTEAVRMAPAYRTFVFRAPPGLDGVRIELRDAETGQLFERGIVPHITQLPIGFYTATFLKDGHRDPSAGLRFQVTGNAEPFTMVGELVPE